MVSLTQKVQHRGGGSITTLKRKAQEMQMVNVSTEAFITGKSPDDVISLQEIKNGLKQFKGNPFNMHLEKTHANAHVRTDMLYLVRKGIRDADGNLHKVKAKELGSRVIFINAQLARELIAKAPVKKKQEMQGRLDKVLALPDRESYGGN